MDVKNYLYNHRSEIMVGCGVGGFLLSSATLVNATLKSYKQVLEKKQELGVDKLSKKEIFKLCWKNYVWPTALTISSTSFVLVGNNTAVKRNASLLAAYTLTETALIDYKTKAKQLIGEEADNKIKEAIIKDKIEEKINDKSVNNILISNEDTDVLMFEPISGRFFKSTWNKVEKAANNVVLNAISSFGTVSLNEWFYELGLERSSIGDDIGWFCNDKTSALDIGMSSGVTNDGKAYVSIYYNNEPKSLL